MALTRMSYARLAVIGASGVMFIAATVIAGLLFGHVAFSSPGVASGGTLPASPTPGAGSEQASPAEFVSFRDEEAGFTLAYPARWVPRSPQDPEVRFLASSADSRNSALVRVTPFDREAALTQLREEMGQEVTALDLNIRVTEQRIRGGEDVEEVLLGPQIVDLGGSRASYYVYTFDAVGDGQLGVHAQYFLFEQDRMITLVLQAIPPSQFSRMATTFDRIAQSFELLSRPGRGS